MLNERLGRYAWIAGQGVLANEAYRRAMDLIPVDPPSEARARVVAGLAQILMLGGRFSESRPLAEEALVLARAVGARDTEGHALNTLGVDRGIGGDIEGSLADLDAALAIAEAADIVDDIGRAYANQAWMLDSAGRLEEAVAVADTGIVMSERVGLMRFFGTHLLCNKADELYRLGRWDESARALQRAEDVGPLGVNEILVGGARGPAGPVAWPLRRGSRTAAPAGSARRARHGYPVRRPGPGQPHRARAVAAPAGRRRDAGGGGDPPDRLHPGGADRRDLRPRRAGVCRRRRSWRGHVDRPPTPSGPSPPGGSWSWRCAVGTPRSSRIARRFEGLSEAWLLLCEAEATRLERRPDPNAWLACIAAWERLGRPYVVAYARWREAEARLAARGDRDLAATALRAALETTSRLGAEPLEREITALAARARLDLEPGEREESPVEPDEATRLGLTAREREVLGLVALGRTNRQIADELFISENTAGVHVSNILGKLGVAGRGEAAAVAYRLGLVEPVGEPG